MESTRCRTAGGRVRDPGVEVCRANHRASTSSAFIDPDLVGDSLSTESDHQSGGEGPALGSLVGHRVDGDAGFL